MISAFSFRRATPRSLAPTLSGFAVAAALFATAFFAAPRQASALFEDEAFQASYESYVASWYAWQSDGEGVEGNYHYYATVYSYYGYVYAAYGDWYGNDYYFDLAIYYHDASANLWEALVFYGVGFGDSYYASVKANAASDVLLVGVVLLSRLSDRLADRLGKAGVTPALQPRSTFQQAVRLPFKKPTFPMTLAAAFVRRSTFASLLSAATLVASFTARMASAEYEQDAYLRSNSAVIFAQRAYARAKPADADVAYTAYLYAYYGREYAYSGIVTGDQGWFYSAAYMNYAAYTLHESIHAYRPRTLGFKAQESAYFAFLFSWYAFAS